METIVLKYYSFNIHLWILKIRAVIMMGPVISPCQSVHIHVACGHCRVIPWNMVIFFPIPYMILGGSCHGRVAWFYAIVLVIISRVEFIIYFSRTFAVFEEQSISRALPNCFKGLQYHNFMCEHVGAILPISWGQLLDSITFSCPIY